MTRLLHTENELIEALKLQVGKVVGQEDLNVGLYHTGGGVWVTVIDLEIDGRRSGRQLWVTRDGNEWLLGFYDLGLDFTDEDEGVCVQLLLTDEAADDPEMVAGEVAGLLHRVGLRTLDR